MGEYRSVWQTWHVVSTGRPVVAVPSLHDVESSETLRRRVQRARVERRLSIFDLSALVRCAPEQLAAYERGDEALRPDVLQGICRHLCV